MNRNTPATLATICFALLSVLACGRLQAQSMTLTVVTNPPQGGLVTGAGTYSAGTSASPNIQANSGLYISDVILTPPGTRASGFNLTLAVLIAAARLQNTAPDYTTITSDSESFTLNTNTTLTVIFNVISPSFSQQPANEVVVQGATATFAPGIVGRFPLSFQWQKNGAAISGATNASLTITNAQHTDVGNYSVLVTNAFGMSNSLPAALSVTDFIIYTNGQPVRGSSITAIGSTTVSLASRFPTGQIFYTLDGSAPDFTSTPYTGPVFVDMPSTLRAIAYSADFTQTVTAGPLSIAVIPTYFFSVTSGGGGTLAFNPPGPIYASNTTVTLIATPSPGWSFMGWSGALSGGNPTNSITVTENCSAQAMFGTTLTTTAEGGGTVSAVPAFPLYPYGSVVQLTATPNLGNYFALWGNAASGNQNPVFLDVINPTSTVSALFVPLPSTNAALTVLFDNGGNVNVIPSGNRFAVDSTVTLNAVPYGSGQFLGWSGDAIGSENPLSLAMNTSKVVVAHFSQPPSLSISPSGDAVQLSLSGFPGSYEIEASSNLFDWYPLLSVTNYFNTTVQFIDPVATNVPLQVYRALVQ